MTTFTAVNAVGTYATESTFDEGDDTTSASGTAKTFGRNVTVDTFEGVNNGQQLYQFSDRVPVQVVEQNFEGSFSVSFVLASFQFLELYDDNIPDNLDSTDSGVDATATFEEPTSFEMVVNREDSDITRVATGCIPTSLEIDVQVDGTATVTVDGIYANEYKRTSDTLTQPTIDSDKDPINFADTSFTYEGSSLSLPRGVTISIENNMTLLSVLGQRTAGEYTVGSLTASVDISHAVEVNETDTLESMYGASSGVGTSVADDDAIVVTMDNGNTEGSGLVKGVWTFNGFTESYSENGIDVEEDFIGADVTETVTSIDADITEG